MPSAELTDRIMELSLSLEMLYIIWGYGHLPHWKFESFHAKMNARYISHYKISLPCVSGCASANTNEMSKLLMINYCFCLLLLLLFQLYNTNWDRYLFGLVIYSAVRKFAKNNHILQAWQNLFQYYELQVFINICQKRITQLT